MRVCAGLFFKRLENIPVQMRAGIRARLAWLPTLHLCGNAQMERV